jgi:small basic protein
LGGGDEKIFSDYFIVLIILAIVFLGDGFNLEVSTFLALMITEIILSLFVAILSEKELWKIISIVLGILVGLFYSFGSEVMRILFQENGF